MTDDAIAMNHIYMPDMDAPGGYPEQYRFSDTTVSLYISLPGTFQTMFESCGKGKKTTPPTAVSVVQVPQPPAGTSVLFESYGQMVSKLQTDWVALQSADTKIYKTAQNSASISLQCQLAFNTTINTLNDTAHTVPSPGESEDQYIWEYVDASVKQAAQLLSKAKSDQAAPAAAADSTAADLDKLEKTSKTQADTIAKQNSEISTLKGEIATLQAGASGSGSGAGAGSVSIPGVGSGSGAGGGSYTISLSGSGAGATSGSIAASYGSGVSGVSSSYGTGGTGTGTGSTGTTGTGTGTDSTGTSSGTDMSSLLGQMLPMLLMSGIMNPNKDLNNPNTSQNNQNPQTAPPPAAQNQAQPQPSTAQPSTAPPGSSSTQPPLPPQGRTPGADGSVLYTFDDGRTQKVSAVVAQALDAARANKDGTDAQAAYAKTQSKWSDNKQIGDAVDPSQLMTGDVATWSNHTAIVVVFPPGQNGGTGSLEAIAQGKLQPFAPQMSDKSGDFGDFAGFEHPHGIEMTDTSDPTTGAGGVVPTGDPSSAATASAVPAS